MVSRSSVNRFSAATSKAVELARRDLMRFWRMLDLSNPVEARQALLDFLPNLVATYGNVVAVAAVEWYEAEREKTLGLPQFTATPSDGVPVAQIHASTRAVAGGLFAGAPEATLSQLMGATQMWVKYSGRDTIARNVAFDPARPRYARVPRGAKTCAFCTMLSSRGWVYWTEKSAGIRRSGNEFHHDCNCEIIPSFDRERVHLSGYDPDAMYEEYSSAREALMKEGLDPNDLHLLTERMRRLFPSSYTDGVGDGSRSS